MPTKVYILGAGCSVNYHYPLAREFVSRLESFSSNLGPEQRRITQCVDATVGLMRTLAVETIDDLAARIDDGILDEPSKDPLHKYGLRLEKLRNAKIATEAFFLSIEPSARQTGLKAYHDLLNKMLPGSRDWRAKLQETACRVLTFNYDRLFEMAFLERYGVDTGLDPLYGPKVLNSGLAVVEQSLTDCAANRFCFLKLHGSIGSWRSQYDLAKPEFVHDSEGPRRGREVSVTDELFSGFFNANPRLPRPEPLIVFPHEKAESLLENSSRSFLHINYIQHVWAHAKKVLEESEEVWVIGYSFAPLDRGEFLKLLGSASSCSRIVVQNPHAEQICRELSVEYPELRTKLYPYTAKF